MQGQNSINLFYKHFCIPEICQMLKETTINDKNNIKVIAKLHQSHSCDSDHVQICVVWLYPVIQTWSSSVWFGYMPCDSDQVQLCVVWLCPVIQTKCSAVSSDYTL